jgi:hypothetical protein
MEEGFTEDNAVLAARLAATANGSIFDIYDDMRFDPGHMAWFKEGARTQPTYRKLIYVLLFLRTGKEPTIEVIREYQIHTFGRKGSDHAVLELMPLPCRSTRKGDWIYGELGIDGLSSRKEYLAAYKPMRIELLRSLIQKHTPKLVIFYSLTYLKDWEQIGGAPLTELTPRRLFMAKSNGTKFAVMPHSAAKGLSNHDWRGIAEAIRSSTV